MEKYRKILERFYWAAHSDGELCQFDNNIREHLGSPRWKERREKLIDEALQALNLPKACSQRVPRRGEKVVKSNKSKVRVGRTRG